MGIFDSIKNGITAAGSFLVKNSGTIFGVAKAVAQVAGVIPAAAAADLKEGDAFAEDLAADLLPNFRTANEYIISKAQKDADKKQSSLASSGGELQKDLLNGVWAMPAPSEGGRAALPLYQDVAAFLQASNIPTSVKVAPSDNSVSSVTGIFDVASFIANAIFANFTKALDGTADTDSRGVHTSSFDFPDLSNSGVTISGSHAYYPVPLQEGSFDNLALHSAIAFHTTRTKEFKHREAAQRRAQRLKLVASPSERATATSATSPLFSLMVTLQIQWSTVDLAQVGAEKIKTNLDPSFVVADQKIYGSQGMIKIKASSSFTPGLVRQGLLKALGVAVGDMLYGTMLTSGKDSSPLNIQLPTVMVTNTSLVLENPTPPGPASAQQQIQHPTQPQQPMTTQGQSMYNGVDPNAMSGAYQSQGIPNQMSYQPQQRKFVNPV